MIEKIKSIIHSGKKAYADIIRSGPKTAISVLVLIVLWMLLGAIFGGNDVEQNQDAHNEKGKLNEVLVKHSTAEAIHRDISIMGKTRFSRSVMLSALVEGTVTKVTGIEGVINSKNTTIIHLDNREALAEYRQAEAVEKQKQLEFEGNEKLYKEELISAARFAQAKSELESAKAQKVKKQIQLENTALKPPFDGLVQRIFVVQGDYVREGQQLAEILDFSPFFIVGSVSEKEAVYIEQGMQANAKLIDGSIFHGKVFYKSNKADEQSRSFAVEMIVDNEEDKSILSGVSATITIPVTHDKAHQIASSSLEIDEDGKFGVKTIDEANLVSFNNVEILKSTNDGVWIGGLPDEANIIIRGQGFVKVGDIANPVFEKEETEEQASAPETSEKKITQEQTENKDGQDS